MTKKTKLETGILAVALLVAALVWYRYRVAPLGEERGTLLAATYKPMGVASPGLHSERISIARKTEYKTTGRNIFLAQAPPVEKEPATATADAHKHFVGPEPDVPPPPPQLPLTFYGYGIVPIGTDRRAFLTNGEEVYIVAEGDILLGRYKILRISTQNVEFEEISTHLRGTKSLEEQGPTA